MKNLYYLIKEKLFNQREYEVVSVNKGIFGVKHESFGNIFRYPKSEGMTDEKMINIIKEKHKELLKQNSIERIVTKIIPNY